MTYCRWGSWARARGSLSLVASPALGVTAHFLLIYWSEEKEETARSLLRRPKRQVAPAIPVTIGNFWFDKKKYQHKQTDCLSTILATIAVSVGNIKINIARLILNFLAKQVP